MGLVRRRFLELVAGAVALPTASCLARAETYPIRPVHIIVGLQAGTASDIIARLIGEWLSDQLGQQFVIENRPGAAGNVAAEAVAHAAPDGYTLLLVAAVHSISVTLYENLNFSFARDIAPVASIVRTTLVMEVNPSFPAKTSRLHRLRQGQSRQNSHGIAWHRNYPAYRRRVVSDDDGH
jgi:tripartite-type tricarboxylate transporter receptor subunit TctC